MDFRKKQRVRKILYSRITIGLLIIFALVLARATWKVYQKERDTEQRLSQVSGDYEELVERELFLKEEIARLNTEEGVEEEIRNQFGVAKEGEKVIIIVEPDEDDDGVRDAAAGGFWGWIKGFFN